VSTPATFWCDDCLALFRTQVASQPDMREELATYYRQHSIGLATLSADLKAILVNPLESTPYHPRYTSLDEALGANLQSVHPSGPDDPNAHASEAGMCGRAIYYRIVGQPVTDTDPTSGLLRMAVGSALHPKIAASVAARYARVLLRYEAPWREGDVSGHADLHYLDAEGREVVCEIKTMDTFAFAHILKEGPKQEHILQANLNAVGLGARLIHLVYVNTNAKRGDSPTREFVLPVNEVAAEREMVRLGTVKDEADLHLPSPRITGGGLALDPGAKALPWQCQYCHFLQQCRKDG
jgi:hypothetical protein